MVVVAYAGTSDRKVHRRHLKPMLLGLRAKESTMKLSVIMGFVSKYDEQAKAARRALVIPAGNNTVLVVPIGTKKNHTRFGVHHKVAFGVQSPAYRRAGLTADEVFFNFSNAECLKLTDLRLKAGHPVGHLDLSLDKRLHKCFVDELEFIYERGTRDLNPQALVAFVMQP